MLQSTEQRNLQIHFRLHIHMHIVIHTHIQMHQDIRSHFTYMLGICRDRARCKLPLATVGATEHITTTFGDAEDSALA